MSKQFKYERFEKLSDAVKAEDEDGIDLYVRRENGTYYILDSHEHGFKKHLNYYRRIEVKPLEYWLVFEKDKGVLRSFRNQQPSADEFSEAHYEIIKMREVIE